MELRSAAEPTAALLKSIAIIEVDAELVSKELAEGFVGEIQKIARFARLPERLADSSISVWSIN
jgi:hypothetical protein